MAGATTLIRAPLWDVVGERRHLLYNITNAESPSRPPAHRRVRPLAVRGRRRGGADRRAHRDARPHGRRRPRPAGARRRREPLVGGRPGGRALAQRRRPAGRRRGAPRHAARRHRPQPRAARRLRPGLEARLGAARLGRSRAGRLLRGRAPAGRRVHRRALGRPDGLAPHARGRGARGPRRAHRARLGRGALHARPARPRADAVRRLAAAPTGRALRGRCPRARR